MSNERSPRELCSITMGISGMAYPFDNWLVVVDNSNQLVVNRQPYADEEELMPDTTTETDNITREVTIDAPLEDVWEAVSTDEGRERWLEPDDDRRIVFELSMAPSHISWWWWHESDDEPARHVDVDVVAVPDGTRVTVTETQPTMVPMARLAASFDL